jgi:hypothetical protein
LEKNAILSISLLPFLGGIGTEGVEEVLGKYLGEEVPDLVRLALTFPRPVFSHSLSRALILWGIVKMQKY